MRRLALIGVVSLLAGCSTTMTMSAPPDPTSPALAYLRTTGADRRGRLTLEDSVVAANKIEVTPTGFLAHTEWEDPRELPWGVVESVQFVSPGAGAADGAAFGLLAGVIGGSLAYALDPGEGLNYGVGVVIAAMSVISVPLGALLGAGFGHRTRIEIEAPR